jgi:hypothetical protein
MLVALVKLSNVRKRLPFLAALSLSRLTLGHVDIVQGVVWPHHNHMTMIFHVAIVFRADLNLEMLE